MTLTIDTTPTIEAAAKLLGVPVERYVMEAAEAKARHDVEAKPTLTAKALKGKYANMGTSVDEFLRERHADNAQREANLNQANTA